jgi:exodeoxyribonuclease III
MMAMSNSMKIATYNVNGVNGRLANLVTWLREAAPDIVCMQELKAPDEKFPAAAIRAAGYGTVWYGEKSWNGVAILARGSEPALIRRGLPGNPHDTHSRYIEAAVNGVIVGCLYLPNGNPAPGPRFDYKLRWFDRLAKYAKGLLTRSAPVVLAGDYNVMPAEIDVYAPERWVDDALFRSEVREAYRQLLAQGWTDALRALHPHERIYTFWKYLRNAFARDAGLRIDHLLLSPSLAGRLIAAGVDREVRAREHASDHAPAWIELANTNSASRRPGARVKIADNTGPYPHCDIAAQLNSWARKPQSADELSRAIQRLAALIIGGFGLFAFMFSRLETRIDRLEGLPDRDALCQVEGAVARGR